jgi:phosphate transport system protein
MTIKKDVALQNIQIDFEELSNLVLEQLDLIEQILTSEDISIAKGMLKKIQGNEDLIDKKEVKLSDKVVNTIVLYQPVASELRKIMACYRIIISLERIGDLVVSITDFVENMKVPNIYEKFQEILHSMTMHSIKMVRKALLSFLNDDKDFAIWTLKNEVVFDEINKKLLKKLLSKSKSESANRDLLMSIITIKEMMSNIERIADHASNIAEAAIYSIEGKEIRHNKMIEE